MLIDSIEKTLMACLRAMKGQMTMTTLRTRPRAHLFRYCFCSGDSKLNREDYYALTKCS